MRGASFWTRAVAAAALVGAAAALVDVPPHLRGGEVWRRRAVSTASAGAAAPVYGYMPQACDHQTPDGCTFRQRYLVDTSARAEGSQNLVLYISGEAEMTGLPGGFVTRMAERLGAAVVSLEHRFYGKSIPGADVTLPNLGLLSVEQALADLDAFVAYLVRQGVAPESPRVLVVGGSYAGAMSSWFRQRYPATAHAAWSSSGVVNAVLQFTAFDTEVAAALAPACLDAVRNVSASIDERLAASDGDNRAVKALFGAEALPDLDFLYAAADSWSMAVQYGHKDDMCAALASAKAAGSDLVEAFSAYSSRAWGLVGANCFYSTSCLRDVDIRNVTDVGSRSWRWQKCSELAYLQDAPLKGSLRSPRLTLEALMQQCRDIFGGVAPNTAGFNEAFGGATPVQTRTVYLDASDDPWKAASVQRKLSDSQPYEFIDCDGCGHCIDLHTPLDSDPESLTSARAAALDAVGEWFASS